MPISKTFATWLIAMSLLLSTSPLFAQDSTQKSANEPPNIIYIMTDDHATQMMSAYDDSRAETPNLDRIGQEGIRFRNSFCTNALCAPARAVLLTGKYSHKNGQLMNGPKFDGSQQTFPKMLQRAGYQTAVVGKWHLGSAPTGFDYWNVLPGQGVYRNPVLIEMGESKRHQGYVTDIITDLAMDWLRNRDQQKPFALLYHHKAPHAQFVPALKHESLFTEADVPFPATYHDDYSKRAAPVQKATNRLVPDFIKKWTAWGQRFRKESPGDLQGDELRNWMYQQYVKDYKRIMVSVDENVGRLLDFLDETGLTENTIVIYTSDNGMFVGDHYMYDKRFVYEEALRVPLVIRYPKGIIAGSVTDAFSLNVDYAPTILDFAGVPIPSDMQGRSLRPILEGKTPSDWRRSFYYHYYERPGSHNVARHYAVRTERYKLIHYYSNDWGGEPAWELVDLQNDPHEYQNIYNSPEHQAVVADLKAELNQLREELEVPAE